MFFKKLYICCTGNDVFNILYDQELKLCFKIKSQGRNTVKFWETLARMGVDNPFVFGMAFGLSSWYYATFNPFKKWKSGLVR